MRIPVISLLAVAAFGILSACGSTPQPEKRMIPVLGHSFFGQRAESAEWTSSALAALDSHGTALVQTVPADIDTYCPAYRNSDEDGRKVFWVAFLSALAKHESTWRPDAAGGGGAWLGLLQISPRTAQGYGCNAKDATALKDGAKNLSCAIRIMSVTVPRDGVISAGMNGVAADWGPFHQASKRADIQFTTRSMPECRS